MDNELLQYFDPNDIQCIVGNKGNLGEGGFGCVRAGFHEKLGCVAIKCCEVYGGFKTAELLRKKFYNEIKHLLKSNHNHVVRVYGWSEWTKAIGMVMDYLPGGNLIQLLLDESVSLSPLLSLRMSSEIANGMSYIHNLPSGKGLIHGDLKSENVLLTNDLHCKISDFGGARMMEFSQSLSSTKKASQSLENEYTEIYAAPERLRNPYQSLKREHDVYSFSIILFEILERRRPTSLLDKVIYVNKVKDENYRPPLSRENDQMQNDLNEEAKIIIKILIETTKSCWSKEPSDRPLVADVNRTLSTLLNDFNTDQITEDVTKALKQMDVQYPAIKNYELVPLQRLSPPNFIAKKGVKIRQSPFSNSSTASAVLYDSLYSDGSKKKTKTSSTAGVKIRQSPFSNSSTASAVLYDSLYSDGSKKKTKTSSTADDLLVFDRRSENIFIYDPKRNTEFSLPELQFEHSGSSLAKKEDSCYLIGGSIKNFPSEHYTGRYVEKIVVSHHSSQWTKVAHTNQKRSSSALSVCDDRIYVTGGSKGVFSDARSSCEYYEDERDQWFAIKDMNVERRDHALVTLRSHSRPILFAVGGYELNSAEIYDPRIDEWQMMTPMSVSRYGSAAVELQNEVYVIGGWNCNGTEKSVERYNALCKKWERMADLNVARSFHGACVLNGQIIVAGGRNSDNKLTTTIEIYDSRANTWKTQDGSERMGGLLEFCPFLPQVN